MTNAEKFKTIFGLYATELWAMDENDMLKWLNAECKEPERKKGKWLDGYQYGYKCSECGAYLEIDCGDAEMNYCPTCGSYNGGDQE